MAAIYDLETGYAITEGLQGCRVCDEAANLAREIARDRNEPVELDDDDSSWIVYPDGTMQPQMMRY